MHIEKILQKILTKVMHKKRLQTLVLFVSSLFHTKILNLTNLGRASSIDIQERSGIRKIDRFLGNKGLYDETYLMSTNIENRFYKVIFASITYNKC